MKALTQISRVLVGSLFIVSGLIKANDTLGFSYKLIEYFEVFKMDFFTPWAVQMAMVICIFEILSGVALLIGIYNKLNTWLLLLLIVFFTFLTGYSVFDGRIKDCGCFGDAIKLTPVQSFQKDLVLLVFILILFFGQKHLKPLFNKAIGNICLFVAVFLTTGFTFYTYMFMPVKDFLPYKLGNNIYELTVVPENAEKDIIEMVFIYEKDGKQFEFKTEELPADLDKYTYVDRKDKLIKEGFRAPIHDFKLFDFNGQELTDSFFRSPGYKLLFVQNKVNEGRTGMETKLNELAKHVWNRKNMSIWALSSSSPDELREYQKQHSLIYTFNNMDAVPLKSMVRSNPGIVLLKDNVVVKKWSAYQLPSPAELDNYINQ